jgi:hypothetical protein
VLRLLFGYTRRGAGSKKDGGRLAGASPLEKSEGLGKNGEGRTESSKEESSKGSEKEASRLGNDSSSEDSTLDQSMAHAVGLATDNTASGSESEACSGEGSCIAERSIVSSCWSNNEFSLSLSDESIERPTRARLRLSRTGGANNQLGIMVKM